MSSVKSSASINPMESFLISMIYAAGCAGIRAGKVTYMGQTEMLFDLYAWIKYKSPVRNWTTVHPEHPNFGWRML